MMPGVAVDTGGVALPARPRSCHNRPVTALSTSVTTSLPLLLLDVDGVLNPFAAPACPPGYTQHEFFPGEEPVRLSRTTGDGCRNWPHGSRSCGLPHGVPTPTGSWRPCSGSPISL